MTSNAITSRQGMHSTVEMLRQLGAFNGPPGQFLANWLATQCHLASAIGGAVLRVRPDDQAEPMAIHPQPQEGQAPSWLAQAASAVGPALESGKTLVRPLHAADDLYGQKAKRHLIVIPMVSGDNTRLAAIYLVETDDMSALALNRERLELTMGLLDLYETRMTLQNVQQTLQRVRPSMEVLAAINEHDRFQGAAMAFCNEVASRFGCERVSIGFLQGRVVKLKALSHTEKVSRKMQLVQRLEGAMEECFDQDIEVVYPSPKESTYVCRAAEELSKNHGPTLVVSLPLRRDGEPCGIVTAEKPHGTTFERGQLETLRLTCDLCTPHLEALFLRDRWFGARAATATRHGVATVVGPKHTWIKLLVIAILGFAAFLAFAKGNYYAEGSFVMQSTEQQVVSAPFEGRLQIVSVEPGDTVTAGQELGRLDTIDLSAELRAAVVERQRYLREASVADSEGKTAEAKIALLKAAEIQSGQIDVLTRQIELASLKAPFSGTVISESLKRHLNRAVDKGEGLFEIADLQAMRAELAIPEDQIAEVKVGQKGYIAPAADPGMHIPFVIEQINPVAQVVDEQNIFRVRVRLEKTGDWMRPGMEGVAKVDLGRRRYAYIWSRRLVNWLRMKLWW